ncbi:MULTISPECIES: glycerol kinase GlpK [unclassified Anaerotruncus]|mgnify:FL=1|uniref:glycerol kinase GlpK n=1 Tax=unclassified Anaerotruncus TaxID=2641626 RepID=UPI00033ED510|nr:MULTISPECIES: glycerol kinase GlpK [unclassified Anaerotruncus]EOS59162.1 glycerol kinase [Anaerotruncus sp. G3(2012)]NBK17860.1 glycerol kinase [Anaerotruncus sp. 1XD42-93]RKJ93812.1 glycerol kinase [Anaerotruncus sp. 1XD22-93]
MKRYVLALDQGTTSSRAILFDQEQKIVEMAQKEFTQLYPREGWVEHDPMEIYSSQYAVMMEVIAKSGVNVSEIAGIGITNQRETTILWDRKTGRPIHHAIVWQCRRTAGIVDQLKADGHTESIRQATGLIPDAYFSATKVKWILDHVEGARERARRGEILFGTVDSWLIWKLTGGAVHVTDYTNASRTMLYNIKTLEWDQKLLDILDIPFEILPEVHNSSEIYGYTAIQDEQIPLAGIAGDQQAALFGQTCFGKGEAKNTYGTGCFLLMNTGTTPCDSKNGLLTTIAIGLDGKVQYALEGSVFVGGAVIQWLRDELRFITESRDAEYYARKVDSTGGVYIVPAFTGLGAPYWDMYARGCIVGLTRGTKREHLIRAAQESIAYQSMELVEAMEKDTGTPMSELNVDGGASRDTFLMQFQSDILNKPVCRPQIQETTALGAAYLAGLATGVWKDQEEIRRMRGNTVRFLPNMHSETRETLVRGWKKAVGRSLDWADH